MSKKIQDMYDHLDKQLDKRRFALKNGDRPETLEDLIEDHNLRGQITAYTNMLHYMYVTFPFLQKKRK